MGLHTCFISSQTNFVTAIHCIGRLWGFTKDELDESVRVGGGTDKTRQNQAE